MSHTDRAVPIADAAELCGVSVDTIKRDLRKGRYPNARRESDANSPWLIPIADLVAAGRYTPEPELDPRQVITERRESRDVALLRHHVELLEARNADLATQLEREAARADRLEEALREQLTARVAA